VTLAGAALLIVDDNEDNRYTLTRRLGREGYTNLTTAMDGREALRRLKAQTFDLVLLDIMMPDMNGYEVLEQVKADTALRDVPIIMISALTELDSVIRCIELGAEDYLTKPFNATLLRARVGASLEKKRLRDEVRTNLQRLEEELAAARSLQLGMLPRQFPEWSPARPVDMHAVMRPAREVGGDLYDCFHAGDHTFCFLVGDVSGKGASAAMFMARTRSLVRIAVEHWREWRGDEVDLATLVESVNRELCQNNDSRMFVTLFLGLFDTRTGVLSFVNSGHPAPHLLCSDGGIRQIEAKPGVPLGIRHLARFENRHLTILPGDALFVCSDGVFEALNEAGELFSVDRLTEVLRSARHAEPTALVGIVNDAVDAFAGAAPAADDMTALAFRWRPVATIVEQPGPDHECTIRTVDIRLGNEISDMAAAREAMDDFGAELRIPEPSLNQLQVALDEIVSNVIKYSSPEGLSLEILVRISARRNDVTLEIIDNGAPFDPRTAPDPPPAEQRQRPGGLGIHMVRKLVDELSYRRTDGRNHTTLTKKCIVGAAQGQE
jgi:sigma-B regulation protein RsbU (phosphoserine phosphatase)